MAELARINRERVKFDPAAEVESPIDIASSILLTRAEKLTALKNWRADLLQQMSATNEGMHTQGVSELLSKRVAEIEGCIASLSERTAEETAV